MNKFYYLVIFTLFGFSVSLNAQMVPDNWTDDTGIDIYQESVVVHGGSYAAKVDVKTGSQGSCDFNNQTKIPVTAGDTYTIKFWYQTSAHVKGRVHLFWTGASNQYGSFTNKGASTWTEFTATGTVPSGATKLKIGIRFYDQNGFTAPETQYIDDLTFESPTGTLQTVTNGDMETWGLAPVVPLNNWSIALSVLLMLALMTIGYKRRIA